MKQYILFLAGLLFTVSAFSQSWSLTGNAGTTNSNFVGTTDSQPLIFKVNNEVVGFTGYDYNYNVSFGFKTLPINSPGGNTAMGFEALGINTADGNTAYGMQALAGNTNGNRNTAMGYMALYCNISGGSNTAIGMQSLFSNQTGGANTAVGFFADVNNNPYGATAVGSSAHANGNYSTAIGYGAYATADNQVVIGNSNITSIGGYVPWTTVSDGRIKKNVKSDVPGLAFIKKLQPVTYNLDLDAADAIVKNAEPQEVTGSDPVQVAVREAKAMRQKAMASPTMIQARAAQQKRIYSGFVAQDVEKAAQSIGYDFSGVDAAASEKGLYGLRYDEFVVPLVKSVQELSAQNDAKDATVDSLQDEVNQMKVQVEELTALVNHLLDSKVTTSASSVKSSAITEARMEQNYPNPFNQTTVIGYTLPQSFRTAMIVVTDRTGKIFKQIPVSGSGQGSVTFNTGSLNSGSYNYSLYVDNTLIDTKKMVLSK